MIQGSNFGRGFSIGTTRRKVALYSIILSQVPIVARVFSYLVKTFGGAFYMVIFGVEVFNSRLSKVY
jgi:hypothetical protein